ncbi:MAG TPA: UDP-N-acetylglucosamine 1-carboxyvinyltransferase [Candidatus Paceibacterota bacterium]
MSKDRFIVEGTAGKRTLRGELPVRGAKNAALKFLAATVLFGDDVSFSNMPAIEDVHRIGELLSASGAHVATDTRGRSITVSQPDAWRSGLDTAIAKRLRASIVLTGPMLARTGRVEFPFPGGCVLGERPIDLFLSGFKALGAEVEERDEKFIVSAKGGKLHGASIFFPIVSVTGTETLMLASALAEGETILENAAMEPEIVALAEMLNASGAQIEGAGTPIIHVRGTAGTLLRAEGKTFAVPPDRIEAGSFLVLAALAGDDVVVRDCEPNHLRSMLDIFERAGVQIEVGKDYVRVRGGAASEPYKSVSVRTHEYPGFPTDLQALIAIFLTQAQGEATVLETIFDSRFRYAEDLAKMGADITVMNPHRILIRGPRALHRATLESPDLRAGLAYLTAAAIADGVSQIENAYVIDRGYERIEERLSAIGLRIRREGEVCTPASVGIPVSEAALS